ncbi:MAG: amino acid ABC transporter permease [Anaerolineales bacterium]
MNTRKLRFRPLDAFLIALCLAAGVYVYYRIAYGLEYHGNWRAIPQFLVRRDPATGRLLPNFLLEGLATTLKLSVWASLLAGVLGLAIALCRTSKSLFLQLVGGTYVELIRNLPPLVLVFIFYYFVIDQVMPLLGIEGAIRNASPGAQRVVGWLAAKPSLLTQFISGVVTLAFFEGAYFAEIIRGGIVSIERGQREAAYSLGLSWYDEMRDIVLPQAFKRVLPALANEFINTIKYSSIASVVSIQELTFMGRQVVVATRYIFETWITVSLMYMLLTLTLSLVTSRMEQRLARSG